MANRSMASRLPRSGSVGSRASAPSTKLRISTITTHLPSCVTPSLALCLLEMTPALVHLSLSPDDLVGHGRLRALPFAPCPHPLIVGRLPRPQSPHANHECGGI
ncbi:hypothetical protein CCHR01_06747 [Colletotrichum chrysophilum]|uniref:Uncharacterized protein n=1 Tax=Colletotrichum chrysophilum TaxID=1836956 RepID=A0AAD9AMG6_9PEZI|nr:hypothetical protein K456DRAFT_1164302 [Colletotrichum gloeosporioides 23]KAK1850588.1 hypothetical protein CCHR01_06747 [Colletotrichum chrysophilum]